MKLKKINQLRDKNARRLGVMPWARFAALLPALSAETIKRIETLEPPRKFCGRDCPGNLQFVTFGTLIQLQTTPTGTYHDTATKLVAVLFPDLPESKINRAPARDVLGVVSMIAREMRRIGALFDTLNEEPSQDEQRAGVGSLKFGAFGIADYYAQRMNITDHETAYNTPWARIFKCLSMDKARGDYEKRLRTILQNKTQ